MFYSHEVLTSRKYGVATVWLVATLGSKSYVKRVSRKAILDVDVPKACQAIVTPEAPMALRLQSNLLYGVTSVYSKQCGYVLSDVESAKAHMFAAFKAMKNVGLEPEDGHKRRVDQLVMPDDPNFFPSLDLLPFGENGLILGEPTVEDEHGSNLRSANSRLSNGSQPSIGGLVIPSIASPSIVGQTNFLGIHSSPGTGPGMASMRSLEDDLGLVVDADGTVHMGEAGLQQVDAPAGQASHSVTGHVRSDAVGHLSDRAPAKLQDDDVEYLPPGDEFLPIPEAGAHWETPLHSRQRDESSSESIQAPARHQKRLQPKAIPVDTNTHLHSADILRWNQAYLDNMIAAVRHKDTAKLARLAKQNAEHWVLGCQPPGGHTDPLDIFTGARLLETLTGIPLFVNGHKRIRSDDDTSGESRRVRPRNEFLPGEIGRGVDEDDGFPTMIDDSIEQGRQAPTPIDERHPSSTLPWNISGAGGSRRHTDAHPTSTSFTAPGPQLGLYGRRGSRLISESPLLGRGGPNTTLLPDGLDIVMADADEFQLLGIPAQVETQTTGQSQRQCDTMDNESVNFLAFVQSAIEDADLLRQQQAARDDAANIDAPLGTIDFETLLPPATNSSVVAAQALLHVLVLGTRDLLNIQQSEPFGEITLRATNV